MSAFMLAKELLEIVRNHSHEKLGPALDLLDRLGRLEQEEGLAGLQGVAEHLPLMLGLGKIVQGNPAACYSLGLLLHKLEKDDRTPREKFLWMWTDLWRDLLKAGMTVPDVDLTEEVRCELDGLGFELVYIPKPYDGGLGHCISAMRQTLQSTDFKQLSSMPDEKYGKWVALGYDIHSLDPGRLCWAEMECFFKEVRARCKLRHRTVIRVPYFEEAMLCQAALDRLRVVTQQKMSIHRRFLRNQWRMNTFVCEGETRRLIQEAGLASEFWIGDKETAKHGMCILIELS